MTHAPAATAAALVAAFLSASLAADYSATVSRTPPLDARQQRCPALYKEFASL